MPDISMCANVNCKARMDCFRFRAKPNPYRQAYMLFGEMQKTTPKAVDKCTSFWHINDAKGYDLIPVEQLETQGDIL